MTCDHKTALCTVVHRAVKMVNFMTTVVISSILATKRDVLQEEKSYLKLL